MRESIFRGVAFAVLTLSMGVQASELSLRLRPGDPIQARYYRNQWGWLDISSFARVIAQDLPDEALSTESRLRVTIDNGSKTLTFGHVSDDDFIPRLVVEGVGLFEESKLIEDVQNTIIERSVKYGWDEIRNADSADAARLMAMKYHKMFQKAGRLKSTEHRNAWDRKMVLFFILAEEDNYCDLAEKISGMDDARATQNSIRSALFRKIRPQLEWARVLSSRGEITKAQEAVRQVRKELEFKNFVGLDSSIGTLLNAIDAIAGLSNGRKVQETIANLMRSLVEPVLATPLNLDLLL